MTVEENAEPGDEAAVPAPTEDQTDEQAAPETPTEGAEGVEASADGGEKRIPWFQKRIDEITVARRAAEQARDQLIRENEALKGMMAPKPPGEAATTAQPSPAPTPTTAEDFRQAVEDAANQKVRLDNFNRQANDVWQKGISTFPGKFEGAIANLQAAGVLSNDDATFAEAAMATEAPEHVLYELGNNPEEAMRLKALPPTQLAIALDRMARDLKTPAPRVSGAPAPITPITAARVAKPFDPADTKATDLSTWIKEREKQVAARKAAR